MGLQFVLVPHKVPHLIKVVSQICHNVSLQVLGNVMPRQSALVSRNSQFVGVFDIPLIVFPCVIVLESGILLCRRVQLVARLIIPAVADVESSDKGLRFIDDDNFAVVGPEDRQLSTGVTQNCDIFVLF